MRDTFTYDVLIIGGSYAGLSAAMTLGRSRRSVLILDHGQPCNRQTPHAHNLITHDGAPPAEIARKAREQVLAYPTIRLVTAAATHLSGTSGNFHVADAAGNSYQGKRLILATGVQDQPLPIPGFAECWGISVLHCPYCHGYEVADAALGVIANGEMALEFTRLIHHWSRNITLFINGPATLPTADRQQIEAHGIPIVETPIASIDHEHGYLQQLTFANGSRQPLTALFARAGITQRSLVTQAGCALQTEGFLNGLIQVDEFGKTSIPGIYAAGDNCSPLRALSAAMAAGMKTGAMLNRELIAEAF